MQWEAQEADNDKTDKMEKKCQIHSLPVQLHVLIVF